MKRIRKAKARTISGKGRKAKTGALTKKTKTPKAGGRPRKAAAATMAAVHVGEEQTILERLLEILEKYHTPITPDTPVGTLVPDLDQLAAEINREFDLPPDVAFRRGEIKPEWSVMYLAGVIALKLEAGVSRALGLAAAETTLARLQAVISKYHNPVPAGAPVGALVPDLDMLADDINDEWTLPEEVAFRHGEIDPTWAVTYLAGVIDTKVA